MPADSDAPLHAHGAVEVARHLSAPDRDRVLRVAEDVTDADGAAALSEQSLLELRSPVRDVRHLLIRADDAALAGYAQVDLAGDPPSAELAVHPQLRRQGLGGTLLAAVRELAPGVAVWAHGDLPGAQALAASAGLSNVRELWQMAVALPRRVPPEPSVPTWIDVRTFVPGTDDAAWVELNARSFADHPEQGRMTIADLRARQDEDWFDPSLLWLATPSGADAEGSPDPAGSAVPAASMWVKVLPGETSGEIYALGVHPDHQGRGLGGLLTEVAMHEMSRRGLRQATLYVEGDNTAAIRTYQKAGFERTALDVQYR